MHRPVLVLALMLILGGCSRDAEGTAKSDQTGKAAPREIGKSASKLPGPGSFDNNDLGATSRYLTATLKEVGSLAEQNQLAAQTRLKEVQEELDRHVKETVNWELNVKSVAPFIGETVVWLARPLPRIDISCRSPTSPSQTENWVGIKLIVGEHISEDRATKLRTGDTIKVEGQIHSIVFEPLGWRHGACIRLDSARVID